MKPSRSIDGQILGYGLPQNERSLATRGTRTPDTEIGARRRGTVPEISSSDFAVLMQTAKGPVRSSNPGAPIGTSQPVDNNIRMSPKQITDSTVLTDPKNGQGPTAPRTISTTSDAGLPSSLVAQLLSERPVRS